MRFGIVRPESERLLDTVPRPGRACPALEDVAQVVVRLGIVGPESQRLLVTCRRFVELALAAAGRLPRLLCASA